MKLDRLLEITMILMNRGSVTAPELAERFGVSVRTIYRDVDALSTAGVPVYMVRGAKGGISLLENFTLPKAIVSKEERESILFSMQTLRSTRYPDVDKVLEKLSSLFRSPNENWISIDYSPWGCGPAEHEKISDLRDAILNGKVLDIFYINADNRKSRREVEPMQLLYRGHSWYLRAWCRQKEGIRTFRLSRIREHSFTGQVFDREQVRPEPREESVEKPMIHLVLRCCAAACSRLYDEYGEELITREEDGSCTLEVDFPEDEWVYGFILSFGENAEVMAPRHLRDIVRERLVAAARLYEK